MNLGSAVLADPTIGCALLDPAAFGIAMAVARTAEAFLIHCQSPNIQREP
jgi:hypothetical protein